jgi:hypothetical protein
MVSGALAVNEDTLPTNQQTTGDVTQGELSKVGFLSSLSDTLFSFSEVQPSYEQGDLVDIRVKAEATETFDTDGAEKIVNLYHCKDTGCDDPPPIDSSSEDQCDVEEWYPDYDDCTDHFSETTSFSTTVEEGETWEWGVEFDAPSETGQYILVGYIYKDGFVTDVSKEKFIVEEKTTDSDGDGVIDSVDQCPNTYGEGDDGCPIDSDGDGVPDDEDACPNTAGDGSDGCPVEQDSDDDGVIDSNDACPDTAGDGSDGCPVVNVVQASKDITVERSNQDEIMATISLINTGDGDMQNEHIIEMQVNEAGTGILSAAGFNDYDDDVCDPGNDQAVHEKFKLDGGEQRQYILTVPVENLEEGKTYDVWIITRNKCYSTEPVGNTGVNPYNTGVIADTVTVENTSDPGDADRDGDGVINVNDDCPDTKGPESNNGCPEDSGLPVVPIVAGLIVLLGGVIYWYE